jgi:hypothetical protein
MLLLLRIIDYRTLMNVTISIVILHYNRFTGMSLVFVCSPLIYIDGGCSDIVRYLELLE